MPRTTRNRTGTDAIALLRKDHDAVKDLFRQFSEAETKDQQGFAEVICGMLKVHTRIEEEIFYPAAREVLSEADLIDEAEVEHSSAKSLIEQIEALEPSDEKYQATVKVLCEYVNHHVQEEQNELFPEVKKAGMDVQAVGERLAARRTELMSEMGLTDIEADDEDERETKAASAGSRQRSAQRNRTSHARGGSARRAKASGRSPGKQGSSGKDQQGAGARTRSGGSRSNRRPASTR